MTTEEIMKRLALDPQELGEETGLRDGNGVMIKTGDILREGFRQPGHHGFGVVSWKASKGAYVSAGWFSSHTGWESSNGQNFKDHVVVGNIVDSPELYGEGTFSLSDDEGVGQHA